LAKARGLDVIAVAAPADAKLVRSLGADHIVDRGDGMARHIRELIPAGVAWLVDAANLDAGAVPAIADGGALATVRGWSGPAERGVTVHPLSAFDAFTNTRVLDQLRSLAEDGSLTLRVADVLPAARAAQAHRLMAEGGIRGRLVLDFASPID
jgi:NADPH:quinone reductase-like Zn-dependent oxidoreductase